MEAKEIAFEGKIQILDVANNDFVLGICLKN